MGLDELTLTITICNTCGIPIIAAKQKRMDFTDPEKATIKKIAQLCNKKVRWERRSIPDWAHVHLID